MNIGYNFFNFLSNLKFIDIGRNPCNNFPAVSNDKNQIEKLKNELKQNCKPTLKMIENELKIPDVVVDEWIFYKQNTIDNFV